MKTKNDLNLEYLRIIAITLEHAKECDDIIIKKAYDTAIIESCEFYRARFGRDLMKDVENYLKGVYINDNKRI